jgi:hypothetical protein
VDLTGAVIDGDDRRLAEDDPAAAEIDECVGGTEVDRHVAGTEARDESEEADDELLSQRISNDDCIRRLRAWPPERRLRVPACERARVSSPLARLTLARTERMASGL